MKLPVVAAIPNYNMGQQLTPFLEQLAAQNYSDIYVLDDASTDESREAVESFNSGEGVHFVTSTENRGAGATRNQIIHALGYDALIHFMDAGVTLDTENAVEAAQYVAPNTPFGFVGGLANTPNGQQSVWNYGPHQDIRSDIGAAIQLKLEPLLTTDPEKARDIRERFSNLLEGWPFPLDLPKRKRVFWNIEQNLIMSSNIFKTIGGFDESLREHEIQDLAIRLYKKGLPSWFDPSVSVTHKNEQDVRGYNRQVAQLKAELYIARKHGFRNWAIFGTHYRV
ncbi:MAG: glycosyltransferase [Candidatus Saccharimonadales bacterium]